MRLLPILALVLSLAACSCTSDPPKESKDATVDVVNPKPDVSEPQCPSTELCPDLDADTKLRDLSANDAEELCQSIFDFWNEQITNLKDPAELICLRSELDGPLPEDQESCQSGVTTCKASNPDLSLVQPLVTDCTLVSFSQCAASVSVANATECVNAFAELLAFGNANDCDSLFADGTLNETARQKIVQGVANVNTICPLVLACL